MLLDGLVVSGSVVQWHRLVQELLANIPSHQVAKSGV